MSQRIIILRGPTGSGKSTIAKSYRNFDEKIAWLKVDNFKDFFAADASPALEYVNGASVATLDYLLKQGFSVVIDGVFQDTSAIDKAVKVAEENNIPIKVFELELSLEELKSRDLNREGVKEGHRKPMDEETLERIYSTLKNNLYPSAIKLDVESNSVEECKKVINQSFNITI